LITASDVGTVLGKSSFRRTSQHVIEQKISFVEQPPTAAQADGLAVEPQLVQQAQRLLKQQKKPVQQCKTTGLWVHRQHPWLGASPDRVVHFKDGEVALLEVKKRSYHTGSDLPEDVVMQVRLTSLCSTVAASTCCLRRHHVHQQQHMHAQLDSPTRGLCVPLSVLCALMQVTTQLAVTQACGLFAESNRPPRAWLLIQYPEKVQLETIEFDGAAWEATVLTPLQLFVRKQLVPALMPILEAAAVAAADPAAPQEAAAAARQQTPEPTAPSNGDSSVQAGGSNAVYVDYTPSIKVGKPVLAHQDGGRIGRVEELSPGGSHAAVQWNQGSRCRSKDISRLRVVPLQAGTQPVPPTAVGQHAVVVAGAHSGKQGVVHSISSVNAQLLVHSKVDQKPIRVPLSALHTGSNPAPGAATALAVGWAAGRAADAPLSAAVAAAAAVGASVPQEPLSAVGEASPSSSPAAAAAAAAASC
jgi:hypothetical protein